MHMYVGAHIFNVLHEYTYVDGPQLLYSSLHTTWDRFFFFFKCRVDTHTCIRMYRTFDS